MTAEHTFYGEQGHFASILRSVADSNWEHHLEKILQLSTAQHSCRFFTHDLIRVN